MTEEKKDKYDEGEYDQEGDMAKSDLRSIMANAKELHDMIDDADNLPEWCQNKITLAEDYISTVANYLTAEMSEGAIPAKEKTVTVKHKTSGKELVVTAQKAKELKQQDYHPVKEEIEQIGEEDAYSKDRYAVKNGKAVKDNPTHKGSSNYKDQPHHVYATSSEEALKKHMKKEEAEQIDEKNVPTSPEKWAQAKAQAKAKFDVYPSAYANGWAAKKYKAMGGGWKSVSEAKEEKPPFDPDPPRKQQVVAGKYGVGYSTARHLARMAMQKQSDKMKKPIKEEEMSNKAKIVKTIAKKKKDSADSFQKDPIISKSEVKM